MSVPGILRVLATVLLLGSIACAPGASTETRTESSAEAAPAAIAESTAEASQETFTITVEVIEFRNSEGVVQMTLYDKEDDFLSEDSPTARMERVAIESEKATVEFVGVKPGKYAIALMHDEDEDGEMKKSLIGIPKEGIGMSNNAKPKFGPPKWKDAVFDVGAEDVSLEISMMYL